MLNARPDDEQELDDVKTEFEYQLKSEIADEAFDSVEQTTAYGVFEDQLTHDEMADIFYQLGGN